MPYATQQDLTERLAPELLTLLADTDADGQPDTDALDAALTDADALIDQALAGRYTTPLADPPALVHRWAVDLAIWVLFNRKREAIDPQHGAAAMHVRQTLEAITQGHLALPGQPTLLATHASENTRRLTDSDFSDDLMGSF